MAVISLVVRESGTGKFSPKFGESYYVGEKKKILKMYVVCI